VQGEISVLSGAPYGYRHECKSDEQAGSDAVIDAEAQMARQIYELYTVTGLSIGAVTHRLNELGVPTKKGVAR
jgi:site-specific DNA recombinase